MDDAMSDVPLACPLNSLKHGIYREFIEHGNSHNAPALQAMHPVWEGMGDAGGVPE
jgi:hypothetical protein